MTARVQLIGFAVLGLCLSAVGGAVTPAMTVVLGPLLFAYAVPAKDDNTPLGVRRGW